MAAKDQAIPSWEGRKVGEEGGIKDKERGVVKLPSTEQTIPSRSTRGEG